MKDFRERGHSIKFGVTTPQMWNSWDELLEMWSRAESAGWDGMYLVDHFMSDWDGEMGANLEVFSLLAALAREVPRVELGSYVASVTHRPPAVLAKAAVTVDHVSNGRFVFGIGAGWNEREHAAYGIDFPSPGERVDLVGETLEAIRMMEVEQKTNYSGRHVNLVDAPFEPKPVNGRMPILIGSRRPRMMAHLARFGDRWDSTGDVSVVTGHGTTLNAACEDVGRDPDDIVWMHEQRGFDDDATVDGLAARMRSLAPVGISYFLINAWPKSDTSWIEAIGSRLDDLRREWAS
jgi:alkanesulfonate monooxygenase SsuD/methylene tetrahydromethanopterin reductase-like flavin-dependent oxidoreductase (luciferase family)